MLRTLLTPLRARFDLSPKTASLAPPTHIEDEDDISPEDFARDVLVELMRNAVDNLKTAETGRARAEILTEIERIMLQESRTKEVFRECDGFLVLMSVLSTVQASSQVIEPEDQVLAELIEGTRLVFMILSEAINDHDENEDYFMINVGYQALADALVPLVSEYKVLDETMGFLLSLGLHDFAVSGIFASFRDATEDEIEVKVTDFQHRLGLIRRPGAIAALWSFIPQLTSSDASMRYGIFKLFELLSARCHRNHAVLSTLGLVPSLLEEFFNAKGSSDKERHVIQKLLKKLLDMGATTAEARLIFQRVVNEDDTLETEVLDVVRSAIKSRWLEHISMESQATMVMRQENVKGLPSTGFTFMMWLWVESLPQTQKHTLFTVRIPARENLVISLNQEGQIQIQTSGYRDPVIMSNSKISKQRWTHLTLVHYPNKQSQPTIRLFVDGVLMDVLNWSYPRAEAAQAVDYILGDAEETKMSWCLASAHLIALPLSDDIPRLIHHLGPRYAGNFQDPALVKFLTYEASTSLNMFLSTVAVSKTVPLESLPLMKVVRDGLAIPPSSVVFSISPLYTDKSGRSPIVPALGGEFKVHGDVFTVKVSCLDMALWKVGGAAVPLRLVQLASTPHELSRSIGTLIDGLRNSWQNSEDMERLRGYEVLADILRPKAQMINMTSFETLFEFLGVNFRSPEQSTIVNMVAYKAIALDFELWSRSRKEIQVVHLEQFSTLLQLSRYKNFNARQRFAKMGLVRKIVFVLQTDWYQSDMTPALVDTLKIVAEASFSKDEAIRPIVTYLAANLHEEPVTATSPRSYVSRIDHQDGPEKAQLVLELLISMLSIPAFYSNFTAALPLTRICMLLLGDKPSSFVATQILLMLAISVNKTQTFIRKFELISGWNVLKTVLPSCWDPGVNEAAMDVLLGRVNSQQNTNGNGNGHFTSDVKCSAILPTILCALQAGLSSAAKNCQASDDAEFLTGAEATVEVLIEELMDLHGSSASFRQIFESQQTTKLFVDAYKAFISKVALLDVNHRTIRLIEKLSHFGLALALDNAVAGSQKREILDTLQTAEIALNPAAEKTLIDPGLVGDTRTIRQRIASARLSIQVGERTVIKTVTRMVEWRSTIQQSERKRLRKNILDLRENRRQVSRLYDWTNFLRSERGLWPQQDTQLWRLDETEGPHRIRKKLEPESDKSSNSRVVEGTQQIIRSVVAPDSDTNSVYQVEVPPWNEAYEISSTDGDGQLAEEIADDKHRRVRHELEPGDVIEAVATVARIAGVDSSPGLLIFGRTHLYMLDGLVESDDGEVIDAAEAPKRVVFIPGSIVELDGPQRAQRWSHSQVASYSSKTFLFRDVALEIYFKDSRSLLIVFLEKEKRLEMDQRLVNIVGRTEIPATPGTRRTPIFGKNSARALMGFRGDHLYTAQRKWVAREISNYTYLSIINQISGRTPADATQYPVFPWVLQDYTSQTLDLESPATYRDFTKPMGAITEARREAAETRYVNLESVDEKPFHYGTHFSSSMIVCHFLIRMAPFTNMFKTLQGGDWDLPDRLFSDIARAYESAAHDVRGDVRELIPEFFTCPEFLENSANIDFGVQQNGGERIHHVKLPPWARQDPLLFVLMHRRALESQYVSEHLPAWIDLIWGCKQRDPESLNVFHPLSYEGSIDLDTITDELEREATVGIIHNFGQTPRKLFTTPHPHRYHHGLSTLPIGTLHGIEEDPELLVQGTKPLKDLGAKVAVYDLGLDMIGEKIIPFPQGVLAVPSHPHEKVEWLGRGDELRVVVDQKVVQVVEGASCTCAAFADTDNLVTGSSDHIVRLWKLSRNSTSSSLNISLSHIMRVHTEQVICVTACRSWSLVVSGSDDGSAALWCLNRGMYIRSIWHETESGETSPVHLVAVNESTGYVATCSRMKLCLHTINGRPMATLDLSSTLSPSLIYPTISSLAFHEREYSHLGILATGGADGIITLWTWTTDGTPEGEKAQWKFVTVRSMKVRTIGRGRPPAITALKFLGESLCHGEESGKSFLWNLPD
ncbi:beach-domain-containing protein [Mycena floridula]|nr:beach-domain-containing protein [Mycena floridula]